MKKFSKYLFMMLALIVWQVSSHAAEWAVVVSEKAIIFSDAEMTSSIGYIVRGKKIRIGEKAKNKGRVVPIIVSKRIAYIQLKDLETSSNEDTIKDTTNRLTLRTKENMGTNRFAIVGGSLIGTVNFPQSATAEDQYNMIFVGGGVRVYREQSSSKSGIKGSLEYISGSRDKEAISFLSIPFDYYYKVVQTSSLEMLLSSGVNLIPFSEYKLGDDFTLNGNGFGVQVGTEVLFKFTKYTLHLEGSYQYVKLFGFKLPENDRFPSSLEPSINTFGLRGMISFAF